MHGGGGGGSGVNITRIMVFSLNLHQTRSFRVLLYIYYISRTTRGEYIRWKSILNYSSRTPRTRGVSALANKTERVYIHSWWRERRWCAAGVVARWADRTYMHACAGTRARGLINRFYCRFTQYRMEDPIMLDASRINHRCSGVRACTCIIYTCIGSTACARAPGIRKFMRTFEKRSETV